jgi:hypothetical protein
MRSRNRTGGIVPLASWLGLSICPVGLGLCLRVTKVNNFLRETTMMRVSLLGLWETHISVLGQVNLQRLGIVFKAERGHGKEDILAVYCFSFFLVTFFGGCSDRSASPLTIFHTKTWVTHLHW